MNLAIIIGNVGRDPETRYTRNTAEPVVSFSVATSETWRDKGNGERRERTEWHNIVIFNEHLGKIAAEHVRKGSKVRIEGKVRTRSYSDVHGATRYMTEIVLERFNGEIELLGRNERATPDPDSYGKVTTRAARPAQRQQYDDDRMRMGDPLAVGSFDGFGDDIPF